MSSPTPPGIPEPPAGPVSRARSAALTAGTASAWHRAVLVPVSAGHHPPLPTGHRIPLPLVPDQLRPPAPPGARARSPRPATRRRVALSATAVAVAVLFVAAVIVIRQSSEPGPADVVRAYFAALAAHDPTRMPAGQCRGNPLCEPGALRQGYQPPQDVTVGADSGTSDDRHVPVTYTLDGRTVTDTVDVHGIGRGAFGGRVWALTSQPGAQLTLPEQTPAPVTLAAARLPITGSAPVALLWAPPGQYTLTRPATALLQGVQQQLTVTSGPPIPITLDTTLLPGVAETVDTLVHDRLDACAAKHSFTPTIDTTTNGWHGCPMSYLERYAITDNPTWTIQRYPTLHTEPATDGAVTVSTTSPGRAVIRYRWTTGIVEPRTWTDATDTVDITVSGRVTAPNGTLEWQPT
ncbi:hypothetical protein [Dactylosporangium sp. CA-139066]|uniref:hypothetical protein n=1 Tax=Dactylosporangium sp. CA-139066 TaxID=3239930 RepID=UPI003D925796